MALSPAVSSGQAVIRINGTHWFMMSLDCVRDFHSCGEGAGWLQQICIVSADWILSP